jgi:hypothetical protein
MVAYRKDIVRFGEGAGFAGAWLGPAVDLARRGHLDYLSFEGLAERTIALAQLARLKDPSSGYDPLLDRRMRAVLKPCQLAGTRIITTSGAANPVGAGERTRLIARELGMTGLRIALVTGDDLMGRLDLASAILDETGRPLSELSDRIVSMNAYLGADSLVEALEAGADVVIAGRIADPSLALAALRHAFGWSASDWPLIGAGTAIGHLTECGPQVTGGYFADPGRRDAPNLANIGYPIAECISDGTATITKLANTGGIVSVATCSEQILYEVGDPTAYLTPDVTADFSQIRLASVGPDRVQVSGASGRARPEKLKVVVGYRDGFIGEGQISYGGANCVGRARLAADVVVQRLERLGVTFREIRADLIGYDSLFGNAARPSAEPNEVRLRVAARTFTLEDAEAVGREVEGLWIAGPSGGGGAVQSSREVIAVGSTRVPRTLPQPEVTILEA